MVLDSAAFARDTTFRTYDAAGNVDEGGERAWGNSYRKVQTRSYYGADNKLRAQQGYSELGGMYFTGERRGYFSEYRYDALGRRVLVRTRRDGLCNTSQSTVDCTSGIERFVWAGDNIIWELRGPGANTETADRLEVEYAVPQEYGIVGYTHAGGVDRPLVAYKTMGGNAGAVVVPHMNWRGLFSTGTNAAGGASTTPVEWPGFRTTANHSKGETQESTKNWMGSLLEGQRDAGGQMYMRNRYYDPATGQFTQTDPIGIAGGLNTYGFAAGDPVSYSDPYGLCKTLPDGSVDPECEARARRTEELTKEVTRRVNQWNAAIRSSITTGRDFSSGGHLTALQNDKRGLQRMLDLLTECDDDDDFTGTRSAAEAALQMPMLLGPARYARKEDIPPPPTVNADGATRAAGWVAALTVAYWVVSEGSRLFLPRNLIPIP
jgi:RHS repeat-associated protein